MARAKWIKSLFAAAVSTSLAMGQSPVPTTAKTEKVITVQEPDHVPQKCKVVKDIAGRDQRIEFDCIEWHWLAVDQRNVAEMQVAVAAADQTLCAAVANQRTGSLKGRAARAA